MTLRKEEERYIYNALTYSYDDGRLEYDLSTENKAS